MMDLTAVRKRNRRRTGSRPAAGLLTDPQASWRRALPVAGFLVLAALLGYALMFVFDRPVQQVDVAGRFQRVTPAQVEQAVTAVLRGGSGRAGFLSASLSEVRRSVEALTWVDRARVERIWPDGLRVEIAEQLPAARWGESGLLNTRGELFVRETRHLPPELPHLNGPEGSEWRVAQLYLGTQGQLVEAGMRLAALELDARGALTLTLTNGIEVRFGRRQVEQRLDCFVRTALPVLSARAAEVSYVDMRYSNGFAIGWKNV